MLWATLILAFLLCANVGIWWWSRRDVTPPSPQLEYRRREELQRFLRRLDHELKNPLTAIQFALANLSATVQEDPQHEAIDTIKSQTLRISELVTDLRKLAEFDQITIERIPVDVPVLLREAVTQARESHPDARDRSLFLSADTVQPVLGDKYLLLLAIYNLIDNALKFTRLDDFVEIRATDTEENVVIEVHDSGPEIPAHDLQHVWEELYRGQGIRHIAGSGLGLAMVKAIVERHGGTATIASEIGKGTTVTLTLPAHQPE